MHDNFLVEQQLKPPRQKLPNLQPCQSHILFTYWTHPPERGWHFTKDGEVHVIQVNGRLQVNDATALLCAALHNGGIILGAEVVLKNYLNSGQLVQVLADYQAPSRQMHILFAANRRPTPKLRSFIDFVVAEFGQPD
ncbi:hypothetical protein CBW53_02205 [Yersinia frederiksenii]|nr:hypothetical protein CBW53_02205 [Yersinia frederiksenii]